MSEPMAKTAPKGASILVVDDEEEVCRVFQRVFERDGFNIVRAHSGESALETLRRQPVDLVILDIRMPGLDGIAVLEKIRSLRPHQRVVMLTAYGHIDSARQAMKLGAYDYITKPFNVDFVKRIVNEALAEA